MHVEILSQALARAVSIRPSSTCPFLHRGPDSARPPFCSLTGSALCFWCITLIKLTLLRCMYALRKKKLTSWGNTGLLLMKQKKISHLTFCTHTLSLIMIWAIRDISPVCRWLYGAGRAPCMPLLFCPCHLQGALWDMTNGVLCLKDCGVWCESVPWVVVKLITWDWTVTLSLSGDPVGRQERIAMRLELAAYPGHRGENNSFFLFFYFPPVCVFDLYIWLKSQTRSTGAIGHQYLPMCSGR